MAPINRIEVNLATADEPHADTRSLVYLGIAGREFGLSSDRGDFQRGRTDRFVLGEGANVTDAAYKDPRNPQLDTNDLERFPTYIRMSPSGAEPGWLLERAWVVVYSDYVPSREFDNYALSGSDQRIWLHEPYGLSLHLSRT